MGSSSSTNNKTSVVNTNISNNMLQILNQNINNLISNTVVNQASTCSSGISALQNVTIKGLDVHGNIDIEGIDQNQSAAISFSCLNESVVDSSVNSEVLTKMLDSLQNNFNEGSLAKMAQEAAAKSSGQFLGGGSSSNTSNNINNNNTNIDNITQELKNIIETTIESNMDINSVNNCVTKVSGTQNFSFKDSKIGGELNIGVISQYQAFQNMSSCIQGTNVSNSLSNKVLNELGIHTVSESEYNSQFYGEQTGKSSSETTGLFSELGAALSSIITSAGNAISSIISSAQFGPIVSFIACIILIIFVLWMIFGGKKSDKEDEKTNKIDDDKSPDTDGESSDESMPDKLPDTLPDTLSTAENTDDINTAQDTVGNTEIPSTEDDDSLML